MIEWRNDVENAPKDGSYFLAYNSDYYICMWGKWGWETTESTCYGSEALILDRFSHWAKLNAPEEAK